VCGPPLIYPLSLVIETNITCVGMFILDRGSTLFHLCKTPKVLLLGDYVGLACRTCARFAT
jgi:hypothetical protein